MSNYFLVALFLKLSVFCSFASVLPIDTVVIPDTPERKISTYLKSNLDSMRDSDVFYAVQSHYIKMGLMNDKRAWLTPRLASVSHILLPLDISVRSLKDLVDQMALNIERNPYLHAFLVDAEKADMPEFNSKIKAAEQNIPYLLTYAMALNNFTRVSHEDVLVFKDACAKWDEIGVIANIKKHGFLWTLKYYSVRQGAISIISALETGVVTANHARYLLPLNILEASAVDLFNGNYANAKVGWHLAMHPPGGPTNIITGSGPANISADGRNFNLLPPFAKKWADSYQSWNMAFVLNMSNPLYIMKLLVPEVSGYQESPENYMHKRVIALYTTLNYQLEPTFIKHNLHSKRLNQIFGFNNLLSALDYKSLFIRS